MAPGHGRADYLLFVDGKPLGVLEAKPAGTVLKVTEPQRDDYAEGMPEDIDVPIDPLAFTYMSTGRETRFRNGLDPDARTRDARCASPWRRSPGPDDYVEQPTSRAHPSAQAAEAPATRDRGAVAGPGAGDPEPGGVASPRPVPARWLIQTMATGSGKTYTAASIAHRLVRYGRRPPHPVSSSTGRTSAARMPVSSGPSLWPKRRRSSTGSTTSSACPSNAVDPGRAGDLVFNQLRLYSTIRRAEAGSTERSKDEDRLAYDALPDGGSRMPVPVTKTRAVPPETFESSSLFERVPPLDLRASGGSVLDYFDAFYDRPHRHPEQTGVRLHGQNLGHGVRLTRRPSPTT